MNFFCTKKHYDDWSRGRDLDREVVHLLSLPEAVAVARRLFGPFRPLHDARTSDDHPDGK